MPSLVPGSELSPNVGNYYLGKGIVSIKLIGESEYVDCGNCPTFEFLAKVTKLDHFSSRSGTRIKDFSAVTELAGTLTMVLEEYTARNLGFAMLGLPAGGSSPNAHVIDIFSDPVIYASVKFVGANDVGPVWTVEFPLVELTPSKALSLIGNTWGTVDLEGDVLYDADTGTFGTAQVSILESPNDPS